MKGLGFALLRVILSPLILVDKIASAFKRPRQILAVEIKKRPRPHFGRNDRDLKPWDSAEGKTAMTTKKPD